ncbi:hypothetical protein EG327_002964 [Venturia inaequalis]|uniref:Uncharacterized protein n=1 Tax=Venturia inaequalis TaxID=5025 RepID=A0A8H3VKQ4_VENIN|nr:hypothetical protein EG327_002964 [Venturia inaequalis]
MSSRIRSFQISRASSVTGARLWMNAVAICQSYLPTPKSFALNNQEAEVRKNSASSSIGFLHINLNELHGDPATKWLEEMNTDKWQINGRMSSSRFRLEGLLTLDTNVKVRARRPASSTYTQMTNYMVTLLRNG